MKISVVSLSTENELVRNVLLAVLASLAKLEREKISQRMKAGLETSDREKLRKPLDTGVALSLSYVSESEAGTKAKSGETDGLLEGSGFELRVPQCALSSPTARPLVAPPDSAMSSGSLNGRLTTPIGGGPATARLTRREDRSAQLGRGPENLSNRAAANAPRAASMRP